MLKKGVVVVSISVLVCCVFEIVSGNNLEERDSWPPREFQRLPFLFQKQGNDLRESGSSDDIMTKVVQITQKYDGWCQNDILYLILAKLSNVQESVNQLSENQKFIANQITQLAKKVEMLENSLTSPVINIPDVDKKEKRGSKDKKKKK
jgi:hypothetical protein